MAVPYDQRPNANAEVQRLEDAIALIDNEITLLDQLYTRTDSTKWDIATSCNFLDNLACTGG